MNESPLDIAVTVARSAKVVRVAVTAATLGNERCHWLRRWNDSRRGRRGHDGRCQDRGRTPVGQMRRNGGRRGRRQASGGWRRHRRGGSVGRRISTRTEGNDAIRPGPQGRQHET
jgi:hypothetical protein